MSQENPFYYNLPARPEDFVGRWGAVDQIVADLCRSHPDSWAIIGGRRFGKSSMLKAIEARLLECLTTHEPGKRCIFPLLVDLKRCGTESERAVYAGILRLLHRALSLQPWASFALSETALHTVTTHHQEEVTFYQFEDALDDLVRRFETHTISLRLALLLDEVESATSCPQLEPLFNQLRALVYDGFLADSIKLVLTGSAEVTRVKQSGSPLLNAVKIEHLAALSDEDIQRLIERGGQVPEDVRTAILNKSGGHLFIAQYLLHHLWDNGLTCTTVAQVEQLAHQMRQQRANDFQGWWESVGDSGQQAYAILAAEQNWMEEVTLLHAVQNTMQPLDQGLTALCYHGLVVQDRHRPWYRIAGRLFYDWFIFNARQQVSKFSAKAEVRKSELPVVIRVYVERLEQHIGTQTNVNGTINGDVLAGLFESAVAAGSGQATDARGGTRSDTST